MGKNLVIVLALLAAGFFAAYLRFRPYLGLESSYTDGVKTYESVHGDNDLRFARWDEAEALSELINTTSGEHGPAISEDGRWFVFASGEPGLNADLYLARVENGEFVDVRALTELNSEFDELAPAFSHDALYFSSNRTGGSGGLDIWKSEFRNGTFELPEAIAEGVNSSANESDPAPLANTGSLAFASDRDAGWNLYLAERVADSSVLPETEESTHWTVGPIGGANSVWDDREPCFASNGLSLVFSSNRAGGMGGFDLWRSVREGGEWLPPALVPGLGTTGDERGPVSSRDGFTLFYSVRPQGEDSDVFRAGSRELFRLPGKPVGWQDLLILGSLVVAALLAWLAKRWKQLEILYKCFLTSAALHFALLFWFQGVSVEPGEVVLEESRAALFEVRLANNVNDPRKSQQVRGDQLALARKSMQAQSSPSRMETEQASVQAPTREAASVEVSAAPQSDAPTRSMDLNTGPSHAQVEAVAMLEREQPTALQGDRPVALVHTPTSLESVRATRGEQTPELETNRTWLTPAGAESVDAFGSVPESFVSKLEQSSAARPVLPVGGERLSSPQIASPANSASSVAIRLPEEAPIQRASGEQQPMALPASSTSVSRVARNKQSVPIAPELSHSRSQAESAAFDVPVSVVAKVERKKAVTPRLPVGKSRISNPRMVAPLKSAADVAIKLPEEVPAPMVASAQNEMELPAPTKLVSRERRKKKRTLPASVIRKTDFVAREIEPSEIQLVEAIHVAEPVPKPTVAALDRTPYRSRFGLRKEQALKQHGGSAKTEAAVENGLAYLARTQNESGGWGHAGQKVEKYFEVGVGKTALVVLAYLGAGHTPDSNSKYSGVVERAVQYLLAEQDAQSGHFGDTASYSHGISTYALAECYALTNSSELQEPLELAVAHILESQIDSRGRLDGGWGYYYPDNREVDDWPRLSVSSWQVMALESAQLAGLSVPKRAFRRARAFLMNAYDDRGWFRYSHAPERLRSSYPTLPGSTPAALFALSLLGEDLTGNKWRDAIEFVMERAPSDYDFSTNDEFVFRARGNLYFWYYSTLAMFRHGGTEWERWNATIKNTLLDSQEDNGSWMPISVYANYAGDDREDRTYTTAINVLTLEVYYRYFTPLLMVE